MSRSLNDLVQPFRSTVFEFLARLTEQHIEVIIVDTGRTQIEQYEKFAQGLSWTKHSKHQDGLAIDICPIFQYNLHGSNKLQWDEKDPTWQSIGLIGQSLGLKWGVTLNGIHKDLGHFEQVEVA